MQGILKLTTTLAACNSVLSDLMRFQAGGSMTLVCDATLYYAFGRLEGKGTSHAEARHYGCEPASDSPAALSPGCPSVEAAQ